MSPCGAANYAMNGVVSGAMIEGLNCSQVEKRDGEIVDVSTHRQAHRQ
jgi:hypothetical protein